MLFQIKYEFKDNVAVVTLIGFIMWKNNILCVTVLWLEKFSAYAMDA